MHNVAMAPVLPNKPACLSPAEVRRSVLDMGLLYATSTRVSWAAGGIFTRLGELQWELLPCVHSLLATFIIIHLPT